ncbi:MAG: MBL fold metallo-hydrolase [Candidatus Diapherotrites archaeon]|nr:MBL fold metallo-hydrolase [Candidatus Diapherotrites archaeon]
MVKFSFLGGAQEVGRSCFLVDDGEKYLLDCGVKLGPKETEYPLEPETNIDAIILSHAHLDHSGNIPFIFRKSSPLTYMTPPTLGLSRILWEDTLKIADIEKSDPVFSKIEIKRAEKYTFPLSYRKRTDLNENASVEFFDAGHILGSAITKLSLKNSTLVYTGDFMLNETRLHPGSDLKSLKNCDYLIIESTYGDRAHPDRKKTEKEFVEKVQDTVDRGGTALIPAFAIGRCQEIIDVFNEYSLDAEVFFDGMGQKASRVYRDNPAYLKKPKELKEALAKVNWIKKASMRKKALKNPAVIVTTAGMLQGGPVYQYLPKVYSDSNSGIYLTGFQVEGTPGRTLFETKKIAIENEAVEVRAEVKKFDFSAHSGKDELLKAIDLFNPKKIMLVHGDKEVMNSLKKEIKKKGFDVFTPKQGEELEL